MQTFSFIEIMGKDAVVGTLHDNTILFIFVHSKHL
jgi:hypothetical protein